MVTFNIQVLYHQETWHTTLNQNKHIKNMPLFLTSKYAEKVSGNSPVDVNPKPVFRKTLQGLVIIFTMIACKDKYGEINSRNVLPSKDP